jgi:hypothetical protein
MTSLKVIRPPSEGLDLRLWRAVVALAAAPASAVGGSSQPADDVVVQGQAESCVFEFDEAYTAYVEGFEALPGEAQMIALQAVDRQVAAMVAMKDASVWTPEARREGFLWGELRGLAVQVLNTFGWPGELE